MSIQICQPSSALCSRRARITCRFPPLPCEHSREDQPDRPRLQNQTTLRLMELGRFKRQVFLLKIRLLKIGIRGVSLCTLRSDDHRRFNEKELHRASKAWSAAYADSAHQVPDATHQHIPGYNIHTTATRSHPISQDHRTTTQTSLDTLPCP